MRARPLCRAQCDSTTSVNRQQPQQCKGTRQRHEQRSLDVTERAVKLVVRAYVDRVELFAATLRLFDL